MAPALYAILWKYHSLRQTPDGALNEKHSFKPKFLFKTYDSDWLPSDSDSQRWIAWCQTNSINIFCIPWKNLFENAFLIMKFSFSLLLIMLTYSVRNKRDRNPFFGRVVRDFER